MSPCHRVTVSAEEERAMIRRRRPQHRIAFSFDSFLDVVTNVVGIILRLILVAWVGAKTYKGPPMPAPPSPPGFTQPAELPEADDPLAVELSKQRQELTEAQGRLAAQLQQWQKAREERQPTEQELAALRARLEQVEERSLVLQKSAGSDAGGAGSVTLSLADLKERGRRLKDEIEAL